MYAFTAVDRLRGQDGFSTSPGYWHREQSLDRDKRNIIYIRGNPGMDMDKNWKTIGGLLFFALCPSPIIHPDIIHGCRYVAGSKL